MFRKVEESQTLLINAQTKKRISENEQIIKFGFGQSPFLPPAKVIEALRTAAPRKEYSSVQGELRLREKMAAFHKDHNGLKVSPENILIAPGSKILLFNILMSFEKADVYLPAPSWVSYAPQIKLAGHNLISMATDFENNWRVTADSLRAAAAHKKQGPTIMIINYPGNPDGLSYDEEQLKKLADEARKQDILVISDEIYGLLDHSRNHKSFVSYYPEKTITTTGLSKWCGAGGWRFGAAFLYDNIEPAFKQALIGIGSETYSCAPMPVQMAALSAYDSYADIDNYIEHQLTILRKVGQYCCDKLNAANLRVHKPMGGFYLFVDFSFYKEQLVARGIKSSTQLCEALLSEAKVALLPGGAFGMKADAFVTRLAYVDFEPPIDGKEFDLEVHGQNIMTGINSMTTWLSQL